MYFSVFSFWSFLYFFKEYRENVCVFIKFIRIFYGWGNLEVIFM